MQNNIEQNIVKVKQIPIKNGKRFKKLHNNRKNAKLQ